MKDQVIYKTNIEYKPLTHNLDNITHESPSMKTKYSKGLFG